MDSEVPTVTILILGDAEVGKSTFLSYVSSPPFSPPYAADNDD